MDQEIGFSLGKPKMARGGHPRFYEILEEQAELHSRKNTDYAAKGVQGPLGNFERVSAFMALYPGMDWATPFGVAIAYMLKQLDAAMMLVSTKRESITGEPVPARLNDVAVYTNIARIIFEVGQEKAEKTDWLIAERPKSKENPEIGRIYVQANSQEEARKFGEGTDLPAEWNKLVYPMKAIRVTK